MSHQSLSPKPFLHNFMHPTRNSIAGAGPPRNCTNSGVLGVESRLCDWGLSRFVRLFTRFSLHLRVIFSITNSIRLMLFQVKSLPCVRSFLLSALFVFVMNMQAQTPTNVTIRILAANLTSGANQRYEGPGLRIMQGLKPDIVAIQEFNYSSASLGLNTPAAFREMVNAAFGTNFVYYRESSASETYSIPNGIISRFPIISNGTWDDVLIPDRGFAWARLDIPGTNDLYVVSVHLKSSSGSSSTRAGEAINLKALIQANFPANAWVVLAGDFNIGSSGEAALTTFKSFLSDFPVPTDGTSINPTNTNEPRSERYDYVLAAFSLTNSLTPVKLPSHTFSNGLVFDSEVYSPLSDVTPVIVTDSHVSGMQHMAVVKDFKISYNLTNTLIVPRPVLSISGNYIYWQGLSNLPYRVQFVTNIQDSNWITAGTVSSPTTFLIFSNAMPGMTRFYRVTQP